MTDIAYLEDRDEADTVSTSDESLSLRASSQTGVAISNGTAATPTNTVTYNYDDDDWGDLMTGYTKNDTVYDIESDAIGNPETDGTNEYTWKHGRQIDTLTRSGVTWTYEYNADGLRTARTSATKDYFYVYNGTQLTQVKVVDKTANTTNIVDLTYDAAGQPLTMTLDGTTYFYLLDATGEIMGLLDEDGNRAVEYICEGYGKSMYYNTSPTAYSLGHIDPLCYRGYVFDYGTGLYYLQSRSYNYTTGRFINADDVDLLGANGDFASLNLFAYCGNNPIIRADDLGEAWHIVIGAAVGLVSGLVGQVISDVVTSALTGEKHISNWQTYVGAAVGGAAGGAVLAATGSVQASNFVTGFVTTGTSQILEKATHETDRSLGEIALNSTRDGAVSLALGEFLPGMKGVTSGRNNMSAVYRAGLTKLRRETARSISGKVITKGVVSSIAGGLYLDVYYGCMQIK